MGYAEAVSWEKALLAEIRSVPGQFRSAPGGRCEQLRFDLADIRDRKAELVNTTYAKFYGVDGANHAGCLMCIAQQSEIGPVLGPVRPPKQRVERWSMSPAEWAGV